MRLSAFFLPVKHTAGFAAIASSVTGKSGGGATATLFAGLPASRIFNTLSRVRRNLPPMRD